MIMANNIPITGAMMTVMFSIKQKQTKYVNKLKYINGKLSKRQYLLLVRIIFACIYQSQLVLMILEFLLTFVNLHQSWL